MNRTPATIFQYYGTEADARGGRFTRKCYKASQPKETLNTQDAAGNYAENKSAQGPWWCSMGPLLRGNENVENFPWEPSSIAQGPSSEAWRWGRPGDRRRIGRRRRSGGYCSGHVEGKEAMKRSGMGSGTVVALSVLGLAAVGVTIGVAMGSNKPSGPPPAAKDTDLQRGYQVLPSCKIKVLGDESLVYKWAASLGSDPAMSIPQAIAKAIDNCSPQAAAMAAISSPEDIRTLYFFLHALRSAAVAAGKQTKEQFNAELGQALALVKMYGGGIDTTGWPGPLP